MTAIITRNPSDQQLGIVGVAEITSKDSCIIGSVTAVVVPGSRFIADGNYKLMGLESDLGGYTGSPTVIVNVDGTPVAGVSNAGWTGTGKKLSIPTAETLLVPGQIVDVEVTAAGTCTDLTNRVILARILG